jgi:hypothetical protein
VAEASATEPLVYQYGCPAWYDLPPQLITGSWSVEEGCEGPQGPPGQLLLASRLWNRLVQVHQTHEKEKAAIWASGPEVAAAQAAHDVTQAALDASYARIRASKREDQTTVPRDDDRAALTAAKAAAVTARAARDAARTQALPGLRKQFTAAKQARADAIRSLYSEFTAKGLGWGTFNDIAKPASGRFDRAVKGVDEAHIQGHTAELRPRPFDGTDTLTVQVMGGTGVPPRTIPALNSGTHRRSGVMRLAPWADPAAGRPKGKARHGTLELTIGRSRDLGPLQVEIPVVVDRYIPADAEVREVKVTRFRQGARYRIRIAIVCTQPFRPRPGNGGPVTVWLDWRAAGGGWVAVAHVASATPLPPVPQGASSIVRVAEDRLTADVLYHPAWRKLLGRDRDIQSTRDQNLNMLRDRIVTALQSNPSLAAAVRADPAAVGRWKSPIRFAQIAARWPTDHPLHDDLAGWRARDRHLLEFQAHESAQVLAARKDAYRCVAKWLSEAASAMEIDGTRIAAARRTPPDDQEDPHAVRGARRLVHDAAPGELRAAVLSAAARRGIPVTTTTTSERRRQVSLAAQSRRDGLVVARSTSR